MAHEQVLPAVAVEVLQQHSVARVHEAAVFLFLQILHRATVHAQFKIVAMFLDEIPPTGAVAHEFQTIRDAVALHAHILVHFEKIAQEFVGHDVEVAVVVKVGEGGNIGGDDQKIYFPRKTNRIEQRLEKLPGPAAAVWGLFIYLNAL